MTSLIPWTTNPSSGIHRIVSSIERENPKIRRDSPTETQPYRGSLPKRRTPEVRSRLGRRLYYPGQGRLKIWTEHSTLILLISKPSKVVLPKFQHICNLEKYRFSPNLKGVAQKMDPPRPFEVLYIFGGKSKSNASKVFKFGTKRVPIKVNNW